MFLVKDSGNRLWKNFCFNLVSFPSVYWRNTLRTCTNGGTDPNTGDNRGGEKYSAAWMSMRFSHSQCFITDGEVSYWGFSHELLIIQKLAILCMTKCSCSVTVIWLRNTFIEITAFLFFPHLWQLLHSTLNPDVISELPLRFHSNASFPNTFTF